MLLSHSHSKPLEDRILHALQRTPLDGPSLLTSLQGAVPVSKETFYRVLRKLLKEEVVSKYRSAYELNKNWLRRLNRWSAQATENAPALKEGDRITYSFRNPELMGIYWAHAYDSIFEEHDPKDPILVFHPHEWLIHARPFAESSFLERFKESKKLVFFAIGGKTPLDTEFKKSWSNRYRQIATGIHYGLKNTEYVNVLGDFIFKVRLGKKFSNEIDEFFRNNSVITPEGFEKLAELASRPERAQMVLIRSAKEAAAWKKRFKKDFYIPKS